VIEAIVLFAAPTLTTEERWVLDHVEDLRARLSARTREPRIWVGLLRRAALARAIQGSNSIEGYNASIEDALAAVDDEGPVDARDEVWRATTGYRDAMSYVLQLADDIHFELDATLIRSLHYMLLSYDRTKSPGRWRSGPIYVRRDQDDEIVYAAPDAGLVPYLVGELVDQLGSGVGRSPDASTGGGMVEAAMAHLNLVMIHPFRDGNGRMARVLQSMVLTRQGVLGPAFCSIEEYLGRNTPDYYAVLSEVGAGAWNPGNDARPWVRFCLTAHYRQARTLLRRGEEAERRWDAIDREVRRLGVHERSLSALFNAALGYRIRNSTYRTLAEDISELVASRDLRALVEAGLLTPDGERRGRTYMASPALRAIEQSVRSPLTRDDTDPFAVARDALKAGSLPIWPDSALR
jgi:Fic family protein